MNVTPGANGFYKHVIFGGKLSGVVFTVSHAGAPNGRLLERNYLFLTPSKTDGRVPSQQPYNLHPDLLGSFIGHNSDLKW